MKAVIILFSLAGGLFLMWACWSLAAEAILFVFGKHWKIALGVVGAYLVGLELYERIYLRNRK